MTLVEVVVGPQVAVAIYRATRCEVAILYSMLDIFAGKAIEMSTRS